MILSAMPAKNSKYRAATCTSVRACRSGLPLSRLSSVGELLGAIANRLRDAMHDPPALGRREAAPRLRFERRVRRLAPRGRRRAASPSRPSPATRRSTDRTPRRCRRPTRRPAAPSMIRLGHDHSPIDPRIALQRRAVDSTDRFVASIRLGPSTSRARVQRGFELAGASRPRRRSRRSPRRSTATRRHRARTPAAPEPRALLLDLDQAQRRVGEHDHDDSQLFTRTAVSELADAHQQAAVAGERDDRPIRDRAARRPPPPAAQTPSSKGRSRSAARSARAIGQRIVSGTCAPPASTESRAKARARLCGPPRRATSRLPRAL